ncbi:MAG: UvrD-helicase domain-containing protein [Rhodocyclaceae bacterium]|nr:UvrD-helicase domain-containing protein [Rhodocyclaceae bacterium]
MSPLLKDLNPEQLQAICMQPAHALILAGAGSGKTRVLTTRIAWLIQQGLASPQSILGVTFTNKAAREMRARLSAMLPMDIRGMWLGTFHGLCNRLLRAHHREVGLPQLFQILDTADQLAAIKRLLKTLGVDDERYPARDLQHFINNAKESGLRPHAVDAWDEWARKRVELYVEYEAQCQREGVVDFPELLLRCYELLERNEPLRTHYQSRFRHILVDEFQDTNRLQYLWLKLLAAQGSEHGARLFCVGDDDQSIYRFRGAEVGNMRDFEREFGVSEVIRLEQNYRSCGNILAAANAIIGHNRDRLGKNLWTEQGHGEPVRIFEAFSDGDEARWIVEEVKALIRDGALRSEIALLYRSNAQSRLLEHQLFSAAVPYRVYGGLRFFERQEIKHALAYLRLLANPDDDTAFMRVVNFPTRGIGARSLEQLQDSARTFQGSLYATVPHLGGKPGKVLSAFVALIERIRAETRELSLPERVEHMLELSGLRAHYQAEREGQDRLENLDELINAAANFVAETGGAVPGDEEDGEALLANFLNHASLEAGDHQADAGEDAVQLMTVHAAKGLEFNAVFLSGLEEGLFPHENSLLESDGLEEERRLMYVAVTRARERLYLSFAQSRMLHGQSRYNLRSRFIEEIPEALQKWLTPQGGQSRTITGEPAPYFRPSTSPARAAPRRSSTPAAPSRDLGGFRVGQNVSHARFGVGVILDAEGSGTDARVQVNFGRQGVKWLALAVAKLSPA